MSTVDVLMITFNAPGYVRLSLPRLLDSCTEDTRVWLWHNGMHEEMLDVVSEFAKDPRVHKFHHSKENVRLTEPTNWVWREGDADYVSKIDDDCLLPVDWITRLIAAHEASPNNNFGALGASRIRPEDRSPELIEKKLQHFDGDVTLLRNHWVQGSGYLLPRRWINHRGLLQDGESWTEYCLELALDGAVNGFLHPFVFEDHMDDPRSDNTLLHTDADLEWRMPLSLKNSKVLSLADWEGRMRKSARGVQTASIDIRDYQGWRRKRRNLKHKINKLRKP